MKKGDVQKILAKHKQELVNRQETAIDETSQWRKEDNRVGMLCDKFRFYNILDKKKQGTQMYGFQLLLRTKFC